MSYDYSGLASVSIAAIRTYGEPMTLRRIETVVDPLVPSDVAIVTHDQIVDGLRDEYQAREIDGTLVQGGDLKIYVADVDVTDGEPDNSWKMIDDEVHNIVRVSRIKPGDTNLLYIFQCRRASA